MVIALVMATITLTFAPELDPQIALFVRTKR